jgi:hypothetical protein
VKRWEKYGFTTLAALVTLTGLVYFWMKYMIRNDDPFAVVNHPMQPGMLDAHVLAAPAFLVLFGIIFNSHISGKLGRRVPNRRSGLLALATVVVMTGSGYVLQVVTGERVRQVMLVAHILSGCVFAVAYVVHLAVSARLWRTQRALLRMQSP